MPACPCDRVGWLRTGGRALEGGVSRCPRGHGMNGKPSSDAKYLLVIFVALVLALLLYTLVPNLFE